MTLSSIPPSEAACAAADGSGVVEFSFAKLRVSLGQSCHKGLSWDCELGQREDAQWLIHVLPQHGYSATESRSALVVELQDARGHQLVLVPRTGRVQLRVHYLTPKAQRQQVAYDLAAQLALILAQR